MLPPLVGPEVFSEEPVSKIRKNPNNQAENASLKSTFFRRSGPAVVLGEESSGEDLQTFPEQHRRPPRVPPTLVSDSTACGVAIVGVAGSRSTGASGGGFGAA